MIFSNIMHIHYALVRFISEYFALSVISETSNVIIVILSFLTIFSLHMILSSTMHILLKLCVWTLNILSNHGLVSLITDFALSVISETSDLKYHGLSCFVSPNIISRPRLVKNVLHLSNSKFTELEISMLCEYKYTLTRYVNKKLLLFLESGYFMY